MRSCGISRHYRFKFAQRFITCTMFNLLRNPAIIAYTMLWAGFLILNICFFWVSTILICPLFTFCKRKNKTVNWY